MTVRYIFHCAYDSLASFYKLLFRWRGSIYKLIWKETLVFLGLHYSITLIYMFALSDMQREQFHLFSEYVRRKTTLIPVAFILGAFVAFAVTDRWNQYVKMIPWPDRSILQIASYVRGKDQEGRVLRRTLARYLNLSCAFILKDISQAFKKRFPSRKHLVPFLLTEDELAYITNEEETYRPSHFSSKLNLYSMPIHWACSLVSKARKSGRIDSDAAHVQMIREFMEFRGNLGMLSCLDWITIPLAYTQVVTIALYTFILSSVISRSHDDYPISGVSQLEHYFPLFAILRFVFYVGWLKVAETLANPFGEDDDDFEINFIADRNLQISYSLVDDFFDNIPDLQKDMYWEEKMPQVPYYTQASRELKRRGQVGSATNIQIPVRKRTVIEDPETFKALPSAMKRHSINILRQQSQSSEK